MTAKTTHQNITLHPEDNNRLANLCGLLDENLRQIESSKKSKSVEIDNETILKLKKITITPKSKAQELYIKGIYQSDLSFGIGPAGTGKTYLAVACAVHYLEQDLVKKIFLARPAIEAGEKLGLIPGDLA